MMPDHYQALGVTPLAPEAELRAAYLGMMREHHPDHHAGAEAAEEVARRVNAAWAVLRDPVARAAYDRALAAGGAPRRRIVAPRTVGAAQPAYSPDRVDYRAAFSRACWKVGVLVFLLGLVLLTLAP